MRALRTAVAVLSSLALGLAPGIAGAGAAQEADKSDNIKLVRQLKFTGGTELAAQGRYVYAGELNGDDSRNEDAEKGGMRIFDVGGKVPREVGFLHCPGNDNTVRVVKPGLIAMAHHTNNCNPPDEGEVAAGMLLVDVKKPSSPKVVGTVNLPSGGQAHTLTPYPGEDIVYISPGGLPSNGQLRTHIVDVSNPRKPKIVADYVPGPGGPTGCHDFAFHVDKKQQLGFCAGYSATQIWDVSDPLAPSVLSTIRNPLIEFHHFAIASSDGKLLAIDDEAFAFHECHTGQSPTGRVWIYDIEDPSSPAMASSFAPPRGGDAVGIGHYAGWVPSWCLSHGLDWQPGTHNLAVTWFTGGVSVLDLSDPGSPEEAAYHQAEDSATYSTLWHGGRLYTNDMYRGVDAFEVKLKKK